MTQPTAVLTPYYMTISDPLFFLYVKFPGLPFVSVLRFAFVLILLLNRVPLAVMIALSLMEYLFGFCIHLSFVGRIPIHCNFVPLCSPSHVAIWTLSLALCASCVDECAMTDAIWYRYRASNAPYTFEFGPGRGPLKLLFVATGHVAILCLSAVPPNVEVTI